MSTCKTSVKYRCSDDCIPQGCPGHKGELDYNSVSDSYTFTMNGKKSSYERGELDAMIHLLKLLGRADSVQVG